MLYVDGAIAQFHGRLASFIALKSGYVKHCVQVFIMTALYCSGQG